MSLSHDIAIVVAWIPSDCLQINISNVHSNKVNYWWKTLGRWQYESRNSCLWRYKCKKSRDKNKNHTRSVFCSTRIPSEMTKAETLRPLDSGFLLGDFWALRNHQGRNPLSFGLRVSAWWFLRGFWLNRIPHSVFFIIIHSADYIFIVLACFKEKYYIHN